MNFIILGAVLVQWFVSTKSRLWGAILGLAITLGIGLWGFGVYVAGGQITFFGFKLSQVFFLLFIVAWIVYDVVLIVQAGNGKTVIHLAETTVIYREPSLNAPVISTKGKGDTLEIFTNNKTVGGVVWMATPLPTNEKGYILGDTPILRHWKTLGKETIIYAQPDKTSPVLETLPKGAELTLGKSEKFGKDVWVRVETSLSPEGYIPGNTMGQEIKQPTGR